MHRTQPTVRAVAAPPARPRQPPTLRHAARRAPPCRALDRDAVAAPAAAADQQQQQQQPAVEPTAAAPSTSSSLARPRFTVAVSAREARAALRVDEVWDGEAPAIVVTAVGSDGDLAASGVAPGMRVLSLPHPTRRGERWELVPGNAPIARVRDLIRVYRGVELDIEFSVDPISDDAIAAWVAAKEGAAAVESYDGNESDLDPAASIDTDVPTQSPAAADAEREARALARRLARRAERNAAEAGRDDTPLLVGTAIAFLGPAAIILAVAAGTGYLDKLKNGWLL